MIFRIPSRWLLGMVALGACQRMPAPSADSPNDRMLAQPSDAAAVIVETEPAIVAYSTPVVEELLALRDGERVQIRIRWSKVEGATGYDVQLSKTLTFLRNAVETTVGKPRFVSRPLEPAVYFVRVRAVGDAGTGAFTDAQVLDGTSSGASAREVAAEIPDASVSPPSLEPPTTPPLLRVVWRQPESQAVVTTPSVQVEGVATRGAVIRVNEGAPLLVEASFVIAVPLNEGRNTLHLAAELAGQKRHLSRSVYYADPARLAPIRERFEALRKQLAEIGAIRDELTLTIQGLEARVAAARPAGSLGELKQEIERISVIRQEIDREVDKAVDELDHLLRP